MTHGLLSRRLAVSGDITTAQILAECWEVWKPRCIAIQYSQRLGDEGLVMSLMSLYHVISNFQLAPVDCFKRKLLMASMSTTFGETAYAETSHHLAEDPFGDGIQ